MAIVACRSSALPRVLTGIPRASERERSGPAAAPPDTLTAFRWPVASFHPARRHLRIKAASGVMAFAIALIATREGA